jgi:uracil-DNA glycosylase family 4
MKRAAALAVLEQRIVACRACPRLTAWRERVGTSYGRRAAYAGQTYWARPVPGFGDPRARLVVLGLAPGAHGGNRTGRVFTGDRSGDWLYAALHRAGFANQARSVGEDDGLRLTDCWVTVAVKCVPPGNKPLPDERDRCAPFLAAELALLHRARVVVCLGAFAWDALLRLEKIAPRPRFAHGAEARADRFHLIGSYHVSQQNTFTGRLTEPMLDAIFARAKELLA